MGNPKLIGAIASLACAEVTLLTAFAYANPAIGVPARPIQVSQALPLKISYDCDTAGAVTLTQEPNTNGERYTYEGVNTRGETLTIRNGVGYADSDSTIYTFLAADESTFVIEDLRNGKATLATTIGSNTDSSTTFNCTVTSSQLPQTQVRPATPVRGLW